MNEAETATVTVRAAAGAENASVPAAARGGQTAQRKKVRDILLIKLRSEVKHVHGHQCVSSVSRLRAISERKQTANGRISSLKSNFGL